MALKKKISKEEQLYMLEVFIDQVNLHPDRMSPVNVQDLIVRVRYNDLPEYEISIPKNSQTDRNEASSKSSIDFKFGKSCLFSKTPNGLIGAMRRSPLRLEVYHKASASSAEKNRTLLGSSKMSFPACMCNQVAAAENEVDGLSTPCIVRHTFDLTDSNNKMVGSVSTVLRLSCFGSSVVKHFSLNEKSFVLEDSPLGKFLCPQLGSESTKDKRDSSCENGSGKPSLKRPDSPPRLTMNDPGFKYLTTAEKLNDPKYRELIYRAYPDEPTCCCLPKDRGTHPMECRSGCSRPCCMKLRNPDILSTQDKTVEDTLANTYCIGHFLSALSASKQDSPCTNATRLKGGGDVEQIYIGPAGYNWADYDADYTWYDEKNHTESRLEGGGGEKGMSSCSCSGGPVPVPFRKSPSKEDVAAIFDACKPRITSTGPKPGCACPGKGTDSWQKGSAKCMKSPCMGIDCLIRAFKEAQEFVDSIGQVPGLPGLGLMDPSESPYFGRDIDKDYVPQEPQVEQKKGQATGPQQVPAKPPCTASCNVQRGKSGDDVRSHVPAAYVPQTSLGLGIPPRLGIVREAIPVLPEIGSTIASAKQRKREEKMEKQKELDATASALMDTEVGPCGEPKCKSRRKMPVETPTQSATNVSSRTRAVRKNANQTKTHRKRKSGNPRPRGNPRGNPRGTTRGNPSGNPSGNPHDNPQNNPVRTVRKSNPQSAKVSIVGGGKGMSVDPTASILGPGGDRTPTSRPSITVSRRVMRYVYFVGDAYPGVNYGHRNCVDIRMRVPANMGWLWNTLATAGKLKPRIGWRPGAIGRYLYEMLQDAKAESMQEMTSTTTVRDERGAAQRGVAQKGATQRGGIQRGARGATDRATIERARSAPGRQRTPTRKTRKRPSFSSMQKNQSMMEEKEDVESPPTLHIHRKDGTYYVTMYPIKQETPGEPRLSEPMKPLQFKIVKNKDDGSAASSSTASDMEIEFSPPAAVTRPRKKPDVVHVDTQVRQQEILDAFKSDTDKKKDRRARREKKEKRKQ